MALRNMGHTSLLSHVMRSQGMWRVACLLLQRSGASSTEPNPTNCTTSRAVTPSLFPQPSQCKIPALQGQQQQLREEGEEKEEEEGDRRHLGGLQRATSMKSSSVMATSSAISFAGTCKRQVS
jgi:hypothetical protein